MFPYVISLLYAIRRKCQMEETWKVLTIARRSSRIVAAKGQGFFAVFLFDSYAERYGGNLLMCGIVGYVGDGEAAKFPAQ